MLYPDCQTYAEAARTGPSYIIPQIQQFSRFCHTFFIKPLLVSSSLLLFCQSKNLRLHAISPLFTSGNISKNYGNSLYNHNAIIRPKVNSNSLGASSTQCLTKCPWQLRKAFSKLVCVNQHRRQSPILYWLLRPMSLFSLGFCYTPLVCWKTYFPPHLFDWIYWDDTG